MDNHIHVSTIPYYFSPTKETQPNLKRSTIVNYSSFRVNEATICHKISNIHCYANYFAILDDYERLNMSQLNDDNIVEKLSVNSAENMNYYLFTYYDKGAIDFSDFLYDALHIKKLISDMICQFEHLLYALHLLHEHDICYFNMSPKNIVFLQNAREKPVLTDFKYSLQLNRLQYTYISPILHNVDNYTYQPFEVHLLFYFVKHHMVTISYSFIEDFCREFVDQLSILRLFSEQYKQQYKEQCIEMMRQYINVPRTQIINDLLERSDKWDIYSISMIFLHIFGCMSRVFSLKGTFITKIVLVLAKNLHPNADKRMSLEELLNIFNKYLNEQEDWSFINQLDDAKMTQLFDELEK